MKLNTDLDIILRYLYKKCHEFIIIMLTEGLTFSPSQIEEFIEALKISISLAVSAVPEGLVVVITVVLSIGMRKMADRNAAA